MQWLEINVQVMSRKELHRTFGGHASTSRETLYTHREHYLIDRQGIVRCPVCRVKGLVTSTLENMKHIQKCIQDHKDVQHPELYAAFEKDLQKRNERQFGKSWSCCSVQFLNFDKLCSKVKMGALVSTADCKQPHGQ